MKIGIVGTNSGNTHYIMGRELKKRGFDVIQFIDAFAPSCWPIWAERKIELPFGQDLSGFFGKEGRNKLKIFEKKYDWKNPDWFYGFEDVKSSIFDIEPKTVKILLGKFRKDIFKYLRTNFSTKRIPSSYTKFGKILKEIKKCDVVITQAWSTMYPYLANIPYVVVPYGSEVLCAPKRQDFLIPLKSAYTVCTYSAYIEACLLKADIQNKSAFHFLFDTKTYKPLSVENNIFNFQKKLEKKFVFFMPARMHFLYKGTDKVIKAYSKIAKKYDNVLLLMLDWGDNKIQTKKLIKDLGLYEKVLFLDCYFSDKSLNLLFNLCDVVLDLLASGIFGLNSLGGLSRGAAVAGKPIITSYFHDKNSFVNLEKPPLIHANTEDEITKSMEYCLENKDEVKKMGENLRKWTLKYHGDSAVDELITLLKKAQK